MKRAEKMINDPKLIFIIDTIKSAYANYGTYDKSTLTDKAMFDLVTSTDFNIENYIISKIKAQYPQELPEPWAALRSCRSLQAAAPQRLKPKTTLCAISQFSPPLIH